MLALKWGLNSESFYYHIVGEHEPNDILEAWNVLRRRGTDRNDSYWLEAQLFGNDWLNYTPYCASINHTFDSNRLWHIRACLLESFLHRRANPHAHVD